MTPEANNPVEILLSQALSHVKFEGAEAAPTNFASAHALVMNDQGEVALVREKEHKSFNLPGGQRQGQETAMATVVREIEEEMGLQIDERSLQFVGNMMHSNEKVIFPLFIAKLSTLSRSQTENHEVI